ncbi:Armadillo-type fold [Amanita muscaria]
MARYRWDRRSFRNNNPDSPEVVDRKVKALLNKLTMEKFDSISNQIIQWANRSENQKGGRTLIQVIRLVFEKATDEATWSEMYARLCRKMMEQISPKVQDEGIKNSDGNPITGGQLFRKYLLNRCQEDFERGWFAKEASKAANEKSESGEVALYSDEYYAAKKAKRQGLGLIKFIGELFKLQILTERIMHECIKKLLANADNPLEEDIESLCMLLTTVGALLDTPKARAHLDVYFQRMRAIGKNVSPQMQSMLQYLFELRDRKWQARNAVAAPATIAQVHEAAAKEKADKEKEAIQRLSMSRSGSRRRGTRDDYPQADGWSSVSRPAARAGDLSQFGRISKPQPPTTFRFSSVFAGKKDLKREPISRTSSSSNIFATLQEAQQESNKAADQPLQRRKLVLQPRSKPVEEPTPPPEESITPSSEEASPISALTEEAADAKISDDVKEIFSIRNSDEAGIYFTALPSQHHHRLVNKLVSSAVESKERDAVLVADRFKRANSKGLCSSDALEEGLTPTAEIVSKI